MKNRDELRVKWINLVSKFSDDERQIMDTFDRIVQFYNSLGRYYHNLNHIGDMLTEAENIITRVNDYDSILFAIWFHDIIYDTKRSDNEENSSEFAEKFLKNINYDVRKIEKVNNLILKTKNHSNIELNEDYITKVFLDLDLLILGADDEKYRIYAENIRKEYSFVPDKIYVQERIKILENFLNQGYIFKTERFQKQFEKIARKNIKSEINSLSFDN